MLSCLMCFAATGFTQEAHRQAACLEQCRSALSAVEAMLANQPTGATWRTFLGTKDLAEQFDRGPDADAELIAKICARLEKNSPGADKPEIARLKAALVAWNKQLRQDAWPELFARAQAEADQFQPADAAAVVKARQQCEVHLRQLDQALVAEGATGQTWRTWLQWNAVQPAVAQNKAEKLPANRALLWQETKLLWPSPALAAADQSLDTWQQLYARYTGKETADTVRERLKDVQKTYEAWHQKRTPENSAELAALVRTLEERGLASELTQAFRRLHSQPNLLVRASRGFIERESRTDLSDSFPIAETIAGAAVTGTGKFNGTALLALIPTERAASLDVSFNANVSSKTSSNTQGVQINTHGSTQVEAKKRLAVDGLGLRFAPTQTSAQAQIFLDSLDAGGPLRQRIAMQEYTDAQPAARRDSEARTAHYVSTHLDEQVTQIQQRLTSDENPFLKRLVAYHPGLPRWWRTTNRGIEGRFWATGPESFAADGPPPYVALKAGVAVETHESFVERMFLTEVGGKTILSNELQPKLAGFFSKARKAAEAEFDDEPWELTFAPQPARVKFDGNLARLTFYFTGFKSEKGEFPGLQVTSAYRLACETPNVKLVREEIDVLPIDYSEENPVPLSGRQQMLRRMVQRVFEKQMPPDITLPGIKPTSENKLKQPLDFVQAEASGGWLTMVLEPPAK